MKRVALVTNVAERCGNGEYGRNLQAQLVKEYKVDVWQACPDVAGYDVVVINWCDSVVGLTLEQLHRLKGFGSKIIFIIQNSYGFEHRISPGDPCCIVDRVVAHQKMNIKVSRNGHGHVPLETFRMIPHGIPEVDNLPACPMQPVIGTAGFSLPTKGMEKVVRTALTAGLDVRVISPSHPSYDPRPMWADWKRMAGDRLTIDEEWLPQDQIVRKLALCSMNAYLPNEVHDVGQSGSVTLMLAARRPIIVQRCPKTQTLLPFEDEIYFVSHEFEAYTVAAEIWRRLQAREQVKVPNRVIAEHGWNRTGEMYRSLVRELVS